MTGSCGASLLYIEYNTNDSDSPEGPTHLQLSPSTSYVKYSTTQRSRLVLQISVPSFSEPEARRRRKYA
jgi:hypothetical protein